jgi:hypothetical protein
LDQPTLAKLWTVCGAALFYFSLNIWSIMQGGNLALPVSLVKEDKVTDYGASLYGLMVGGALLFVQLLITRLYANRTGKAGWADRVPVVGGFPLNTVRRRAEFIKVS